ncbi:MAG: hypothetical protein ACI9W2_002162 [Gammaproteobacteria bacterium]|jgi:hypothetical protein
MLVGSMFDNAMIAKPKMAVTQVQNMAFTTLALLDWHCWIGIAALAFIHGSFIVAGGFH